jgi:orsellinic acid C2-O-methyltransferase
MDTANQGESTMATTAGVAASSAQPSAYRRLVELLMGSRITMGLRVVVERKIPDLLGDDRKSVDELASEAGIPAGSLRRLMRALSYIGVFKEQNDGRFSNNEVSVYLRSDAESSLREMSLVLNSDAWLGGWQQLDRVLQTGMPAFPEVNGQTVFQYISSDARRSENFARFMKGIYGPEGPRIAAGFAFGRFSRLIDVGAGAGNILADILRTHAGVTGAVFDLPRTADVARKFLADQDLSDRSEVIAGDFFHEVTPGYDAYFIKSVLHDWDDEQSVRILANIKRAMPEHGRVLITEIVLDPGKPIGHPIAFVDLEMMVTLGGKERTAQEFSDLLRAAHLRLEQVHPIRDSFFSIVEGSRG